MEVIASSRKSGRMWARVLWRVDTAIKFRWGTSVLSEQETIPSARAISDTANKCRMAEILREHLGDRFPMLDVENMTFPAVKKRHNHVKGRGVSLINTPDEIEAGYYFMKYIPTKVEYRVIADRYGRHFVIFKKIRTNNDDFRMNYALGNCEYYRVKAESPPQIIRDLAVKSVKALGLLIGGVDIGINEQDKRAYVFEVNSAPNMARTYRCREFLSAIQEALNEAQNGGDLCDRYICGNSQ